MLNGENNPILKDILFLKIGEAQKNKFILTASFNEKQTKKVVDENQVAEKIDYKITIKYNF